MKYFSFIIVLAFIFTCTKNSKSLVYTMIQKIPVIDFYFGEEVIDNYRWLEDDNREETKS